MTELFAKQALLPDGWRRNVTIAVGKDGTFSAIFPDSAPQAGAERFDVVVPPQISLHSHAFQRAMGGLAEKRQNPDDTFWTWRTLMYQLAHRISPEQMQNVAAFLYMQMLKAGYSQVAEFHYLHNEVDGRAYASPAEMSSRLVAAATDAGLGITLLPTLYARGGLDGSPLADAQKRFAGHPDRIARIVSDIRSHWRGSNLVHVGIGLHSLRAVDIQSIGDFLNVAGPGAPIHIHVAEQQREVDACLAVTGQRPVDYLMSHLAVDERWCLVHATHLSEAEVTSIASSRAVAGLCPITEANLGDGIFPFESYVDQGGHFGIGSDSNVLISPWEELRLLEYGLRLNWQKRCVALPAGRKGSIGGWLFQQSLKGGAQACGLPVAGLVPGARADLCVIDEDALSLPDLEGDDLLDSAIFATSRPPVRHVMSDGRWRIIDGHHPDEKRITNAFRASLRDLMSA
ncbi:N-formimino-L-glutamate deiminase [Gluconacetobacter johannae DSM 13595]|uniref:Formimidoylglutamate deiminase n=1 Tax=Gluconacetobacter johannae TaxID=112140 RepID=A0A7W4JA47_9PROT|nr:formimidoylglutamate deiminase [Gluconacetobacter johannae]MBB2177383.1 formimidoylglutamate deiminase [Gluconacetobacter johannae]GBQ81223.1 N-formimino-L-glutamate deiminase [Gluconacetobacter johannae DSM 13595]